MSFDTTANIYDKNGYLSDGIHIEYHCKLDDKLDDIPAIAIEYRNMRMNGFYKTFSKTGQLISDRYCLNGFFHGISKYYDENGNIILEEHYDTGRKINIPKITNYTSQIPNVIQHKQRRYSL